MQNFLEDPNAFPQNINEAGQSIEELFERYKTTPSTSTRELFTLNQVLQTNTRHLEMLDKIKEQVKDDKAKMEANNFSWREQEIPASMNFRKDMVKILMKAQHELLSPAVYLKPLTDIIDVN